MQKYFLEARNLLVIGSRHPGNHRANITNRHGVVDTIMAGAYSATDMAAVAVGTSIWLPVILFGHGLLLALTPVIAPA